MKTRISIITVCLNAESVIEKCLQSVIEQTYSNIEYIVIDGQSDDGTIALIERYRENITVFLSEKDGGIYPAMNKGIALASGDYVLMLNADDYLLAPDVIAKVVAAMESQPAATVCYGLMEVRYVNGTVTVYDAGPPQSMGDMMILGCLPSQATFIKRKAFDVIGPFDESYKLSADYDWYLKAMARDDMNFVRLDILCSSFYMGGASANLEKCRSEMNLIQNGSAFYRSESWQKKLLIKWQTDSLEWRQRYETIESQLRAKKKDAKELVETCNALVKERQIFISEREKLREGLSALDAERVKLQKYLNDANRENEKLAGELASSNAQLQQMQSKRILRLERAIRSRLRRQ